MFLDLIISDCKCFFVPRLIILGLGIFLNFHVVRGMGVQSAVFERESPMLVRDKKYLKKKKKY